ncbi:hypothetical protein SeAg_B2804 [Salmonella enterica subsp. enterica serovar Agona str. SL483]|uniref:Uncharacterized protein n=1 Tax=Salmonella agona (strain SL483) TaxID=454166 RepID=B5F272_SALA4|nr:hypothetical protein SeAg_B2804 [Salmonella enterica subsp. enterica serovar Agona str. SL483]
MSDITNSIKYNFCLSFTIHIWIIYERYDTTGRCAPPCP